MSGLATAVFAAQSGSHLVDVPRSARFAEFLRAFDEEGYRLDLARRGFRWVPRGDPGFPTRLAAIHDPPPGLFVRGDAPLGLLDQPAVAVVGARACSAYGSAVAVSLVSRHSPVVAERVSTSRFTRMIARMWPSHSVSARLPPGANTSTVRVSSRHRRFLSAVWVLSTGAAVSHSAAMA